MPGGRIEYPEYPERAYEEGLVNALIHRDYLELGSEVHVDIFDDRMEIYSPGGMPSGQKVQDLDVRQVSSKRRNPVIADVFQRLELMERRGSGFKKILDAYAFESEKRGETVVPEMTSTQTDFFLTLPNFNYGRQINGVVSSSEDLATEAITQATTDVTTEVITDVSPEVQRLTLAIETETSADRLMELVGIKQREDFRIRFLKPAIGAGMVEMTQPNSPRSPTQKYRLTAKGKRLVANMIANDKEAMP